MGGRKGAGRKGSGRKDGAATEGGSAQNDRAASAASRAIAATADFSAVPSGITSGNVTSDDITPNNVILSDAISNNVILSDSEGSRDTETLRLTPLAQGDKDKLTQGGSGGCDAATTPASTTSVVLSGAAGAAEPKDPAVSRETSRAEANNPNVSRETAAIHRPSAAQAAILKMATTVLLRGLRPHELVMLDELCGFGFAIDERTIGLGDDVSDAGVSRETSHETEVPCVSRETQVAASSAIPSNPASPIVLSGSTPSNVTPNDSTPDNVVLSDSEGPRDTAGIPVATLAAIIAERFPSADLSPAQIESALRVLSYEHFTKPTRKSYGDDPLIEIIDGQTTGDRQSSIAPSSDATGNGGVGQSSRTPANVNHRASIINANHKHPSIMDAPAQTSTPANATAQTTADRRRVRLSPTFAQLLRDDRTFRAFLADTVRVGLLNCRDLFAEARRQQRRPDRGFLVEQRYSMADVMRLCCWANANTPQNVGGYALDPVTGTMPIMVKYASSQYEDEFLGPQEMCWYSKNRQTPQSTVFRWLRGELDGAGAGASANAATTTGAGATVPAPRTDEITRPRADAETASASAESHAHTNADAGSRAGAPAPTSIPAPARWEDTHFVPLFVMRRADAERAAKRSETPYYYYVGHVTAVEHPTLTQKPSADGKSPINVTVSTLRLSQPLEPELFRHLTGKHSM